MNDSMKILDSQKQLDGRVIMRNPTQNLRDYLAIGNVDLPDDPFGIGDAEEGYDDTNRTAMEQSEKKTPVHSETDPFNMNGDSADNGAGGSAPQLTQGAPASAQKPAVAPTGQPTGQPQLSNVAPQVQATTQPVTQTPAPQPTQVNTQVANGAVGQAQVAQTPVQAPVQNVVPNVTPIQPNVVVAPQTGVQMPQNSVMQTA